MFDLPQPLEILMDIAMRIDKKKALWLLMQYNNQGIEVKDLEKFHQETDAQISELENLPEEQAEQAYKIAVAVLSLLAEPE